MRVFIVTYNDPYSCADDVECCHDHKEIKRVYRTRKGAEKYINDEIKRNRLYRDYNFDIETFETSKDGT